MVFLVPMWKETLDFDMHAKAGKPTPVKSLVRGFVGVANIGLDENWSGNQLSQANLYGYGRLAWNPDLSAQRIVDEWTRLTFGAAPKVVETITAMQLSSWRTFENYTGPLRRYRKLTRLCFRKMTQAGDSRSTRGTEARRARLPGQEVHLC
jgi:alpha-glucuronidase